MTLAVVGTLSTYKQSNKQKETKNTKFQHNVLLDNTYGNGFFVNFIESEAQKRVPGIKKKGTKHVIVVSENNNKSNKDKN